MSLTVNQLRTVMATRTALLAQANGVYQMQYDAAARQYSQRVPWWVDMIPGSAQVAATAVARQLAPPVVAAATDVQQRLEAVREHWQDFVALAQDPAHYGVPAADVDSIRNGYVEAQKNVTKAQTLLNQFNHSRWHLVDPLTVTGFQAYVVGLPRPGPGTSSSGGSLWDRAMRFFVDPQYGREPTTPPPDEGGAGDLLREYGPYIGVAAGIAVGLVAIKFLKGGS